MLELQDASSPEELLLITAYQWFELWFLVMRTDLDAVLADRGQTFESVKLLRRGLELFDLFDLQLAFDENWTRDLHVTKTLRAAQGFLFSEQLNELVKQARRLRPITRATFPGLADTITAYNDRLKTFRSRYGRLVKATLVKKRAPAPTFAGWLKLPELLNVQQGVKADWALPGQCPPAYIVPEQVSVDENMFIVVHQAFELWFKVMLDHVDRAIGLLMTGAIEPATRLVRRVVQIQKLLVQQIQIPATMLPLDFARFRQEQSERNGQVLQRGLSPASGTESYQFRELEIVCGLRDDPVFRKYLDGSSKLPIRLLTPRQAERLERPTVADAFRFALRQRGIEQVDRIFTPANVPNLNADLAELAGALIELDEAFHFWRVGHVSMVQKMIGAKSGTGFLGPEYLMETAGIRVQEKNRIFEDQQVRPRFFQELWDVRSRLGVY